MNLLQLNVNRSKASQSLLYANAVKTGADILIVSEPNRNSISGNNWKADPEGDSAILLLNTRKAILQGGSGRGFVWLELTDLRIFSCYFSPNKALGEIEQALDELGEAIRGSRKGAIIAGDFNAKSPVWGEHREDARGRLVTDWAAGLGLTCLNEGTVPTFVRGESSSRLDITFCTEGVERKLETWTVLDTETLSDHQCIDIKLSSEQRVTPQYSRGWRVDTPGCERLRVKIQEMMDRVLRNDSESLTGTLGRACEESLQKRGLHSRKKPAYWWTAELGGLRKQCLAARRRVVRENRRTRGRAPEQLKAALSNARREFRTGILKSMNLRWKEVCENINQDVWGKGYQIVMRKIGRPLPVLSPDLLQQVVETLFPRHPAVKYEEMAVTEIPLFTMDELEKAWKRLKTRRSAGPDGIPPEAVRLAAENQPGKVLQVMNAALVNEDFPKEWKRAKLILLKKEGKPDNLPSSYRPLCLLDTLGKLLEHLLLSRLNDEVERTGGLAQNQFGFREGCSTISAIQKVLQLADNAANRGRSLKLIPAVITLDVRNAFNSASWQIILDVLKERGVKDYLRRIIQQYFTDRKILVESEQESYEVDISSGVPQGSILGPALWNIMYDGVLRLALPVGVTSVGYADDLALVITAKTEQLLMVRANRAIHQVDTWLQLNGLRLAPEKTEAIVLAGRRTLADITFQANGIPIRPVKKLRYLGVWLDHRRSFQVHVNEVSKRSDRVAGCLGRLMGNISGPSPSKRKLLASVVESISLYAAPVWARALTSATAKRQLNKVQRKMAIRVCSGYRTISNEAAFVIAGIPPLDLLARERTDRYTGMEKSLAREALLARWQDRWATSQKGAWTRKLIPDLAKWVQRDHGEPDFYLTQFLSGHGHFQTYLCKMHIANSADCRYCGEEDTPDHTVLDCDRWYQLRRGYLAELGDVTTDNLADKMLESPEKWETFKKMVRAILSRKKEEEREL